MNFSDNILKFDRTKSASDHPPTISVVSFSNKFEKFNFRREFTCWGVLAEYLVVTLHWVVFALLSGASWYSSWVSNCRSNFAKNSLLKFEFSTMEGIFFCLGPFLLNCQVFVALLIKWYFSLHRVWFMSFCKNWTVYVKDSGIPNRIFLKGRIFAIF